MGWSGQFVRYFATYCAPYGVQVLVVVRRLVREHSSASQRTQPCSFPTRLVVLDPDGGFAGIKIGGHPSPEFCCMSLPNFALFQNACNVAQRQTAQKPFNVGQAGDRPCAILRGFTLDWTEQMPCSSRTWDKDVCKYSSDGCPGLHIAWAFPVSATSKLCAPGRRVRQRTTTLRLQRSM